MGVDAGCDMFFAGFFRAIEALEGKSTVADGAFVLFI